MLVEATYHGASTVVSTTQGRTEVFPSTLAYVNYVLCELLFADDLAVVTYT